MVLADFQVGTTIRALGPGEEETLLTILDNAFGPFHNLTDARAVLSSPKFDPNACFIAVESGQPSGSVAVTTLPRDKWFVIRYFAVRPGERKSQIAEALLARALEYTRSKGAEFVRATSQLSSPT